MAAMLLVCLCFLAFGYADAQLTQNPTFSYTFNPPFQWTFNPNSLGLWPRQYLTAAEANQSMFNDVQGSFLQAMQAAGYSTFVSSMKYSITGYAPTTNITISQQNVANTYVPEVGAVTGFRPTTTSIQPYPQTQQILVTQGILYLTTSQWQVVATYLYNFLNQQHNVHFLSQISVS